MMGPAEQPWEDGMTPSKLKAYETCPRQYYHVEVAKDVDPLPPDERQVQGHQVHAVLDAWIRERLAGKRGWLPPAHRWIERRLEAILSRPGLRVQSEVRLALDRQMRPCGWDDAALRGIADLLITDGRRSMVIDWKTGKRRPWWLQLDFYALAHWRSTPGVLSVRTAFFWLREPSVDMTTMYASQRDRTDATLRRRLKEIDEDTTWRARPSGLCKQWCPVRSCQYNGLRNAA